MYNTIFDIEDSNILTKSSVNLVFHGLDTHADVYLNHNHILKANNQFRRWTVDIKVKQYKININYIKLLSLYYRNF